MIWLAWLVFLGLLTWTFSAWLDHEENPNRSVVGRVTTDGLAEVRLQRNRRGHYLSAGAINGQSVTFLLDTGASDVNIPAGVAERLGLRAGAAMRARTANGSITVYSTRLDEVAIGPIRVRDVPASINPNMPGEQILLGMSVLKHLELLQRGDTLTLRAPHD